MAIFNTSLAPNQNVNIVGGSSFYVVNVACVLANTEYTYSVPNGVTKFKMQVRGHSVLKLANAVGLSGTTYLTVGAGSTYEDDLLTTSGVILYFQTTQPNQVVEILYWI